MKNRTLLIRDLVTNGHGKQFESRYDPMFVIFVTSAWNGHSNWGKTMYELSVDYCSEKMKLPVDAFQSELYELSLIWTIADEHLILIF